jgi:hypothetical protein
MHHKLMTVIEQLKQIYEMSSTLNDIDEDIGNHSVNVTEGFRDSAVESINEIQESLHNTRDMLDHPDFLTLVDDMIKDLETAGKLEDQMYEDTISHGPSA